jgi:integrase
MDESIPTTKMPKKLPIILSPEEVLKFLGCISNNKHRTVLTTCYATGLRPCACSRVCSAAWGDSLFAFDHG